MIEVGLGEAWIRESTLADSEDRELKQYSIPESVVSGHTAPIPQVVPNEDIFYPSNHFPQDADVYIISPNGEYVLFGFELTPVRRF